MSTRISPFKGGAPRKEDRPTRRAWEALHTQRRFLPRYPAEEVVRFAFARLAPLQLKGRRLSVADIGCGGGRHSAFLAEAGFRVTALDFSSTGVDGTRRLLKERGMAGKVVAGDFKRLPFPKGAFDAVVAYGSLYYSDFKGMAEGVRELHRVLKRGGWALVVIRTSEDCRAKRGSPVDGRSVRIEDNDTNEGGMVMSFASRADVDRLFAGFSAVEVDRHEYSFGGGKIFNSDWVVSARK